MKYNSDTDVLVYHDFDLVTDKDSINETDLEEIMSYSRDNDLYEYYKNNSFPFDDNFYKKLDTSFKTQIKQRVDENIHALYLMFFALLRIKYGKQTPMDIRITKYIFSNMPKSY